MKALDALREMLHTTFEELDVINAEERAEAEREARRDRWREGLREEVREVLYTQSPWQVKTHDGNRTFIDLVFAADAIDRLLDRWQPQGDAKRPQSD